MGRIALWIRNSPIITNFINTPVASSSFSIISLALCPLSFYSCYQSLVLSSWLFNWVGGGEVTVLFSSNTKGVSNIWKWLNGTFWWMNASIYFRRSSLIRTHSPVSPCSCRLSIFWGRNQVDNMKNKFCKSFQTLMNWIWKLSILSLAGVAYFYQGPSGLRLDKTEQMLEMANRAVAGDTATHRDWLLRAAVGWFPL